MTTTQEDRIIEKFSQEVKKALVKKYGSLQDTCSEAALAMKKLLDDEDFCVKISLSGALRVERIRAVYAWNENEYEHEYVRVDGIDYDPTREQFSGFEINMEVIEENADFPDEKFIGNVDDIIESVKKSFEEKEVGMKIYNYAILLNGNEDFGDVFDVEGEIAHEAKHPDDAVCDATTRLRDYEDREEDEQFAGGTVAISDLGKITEKECDSGYILEEEERDRVKINHTEFVKLDDGRYVIEEK